MLQSGRKNSYRIANNKGVLLAERVTWVRIAKERSNGSGGDGCASSTVYEGGRSERVVVMAFMMAAAHLCEPVCPAARFVGSPLPPNGGHQYPMLAQEAPASAKIRLRVTPTDGSSKQDTLRPNRKIEENAAVKCLRVVVEVQAKARLPHELIILLGVELHGRMRVEWSRGRVCVSCNAEQRGKK
uniref:Uncharacterized protein n=1 Tax=Vespula pensylvanica TaxID=30213 RepID=A0A834P5U2_VESPE|nr:hypothetical protein H0235_006023 [Vespula pensylvanica]